MHLFFFLIIFNLIFRRSLGSLRGPHLRNRHSSNDHGGSSLALEAHPGKCMEAHPGLGGSPWSGGSSWSVEAHPRTLEAHPGGDAHYGAWRHIPRTLEAHPGGGAHYGAWMLTHEPWRLTREWMLIMERGCLPTNLGGSPWSGCLSWSVEAHPRTLEAHPGVETHHGGWKLTLEPWRLTLEAWRPNLPEKRRRGDKIYMSQCLISNNLFFSYAS
jgi:hypothetical protein